LYIDKHKSKLRQEAMDVGKNIGLSLEK